MLCGMCPCMYLVMGFSLCRDWACSTTQLKTLQKWPHFPSQCILMSHIGCRVCRKTNTNIHYSHINISISYSLFITISIPIYGWILNRMFQEYVYVTWQYQSTMLNIKYYSRHENKVNEKCQQTFLNMAINVYASFVLQIMIKVHKLNQCDTSV